nr:uncharacterized protein LOC125418625 [Ziziphus jujuba var. spinosa]
MDGSKSSAKTQEKFRNNGRAQYMSRGHYFTLEDGNSKQVTMKVHHLVVVSHVSNKTLDSVLRTAQLRTLLPSSSNSFDYLSNGAVNQLGRELPETIGDLRYLLYLDLSNTFVETLPESVDRKVRGAFRAQRKCLPREFRDIANGEDASEARLVNKEKIEELTFSWSRDTEDPEDDKGVLEELLSGTELKRLNIIGARRTALPQNSLLKQLDGVVRVNEEVYGTNGKFSSLESLSFSSMSTWKEWNSTEVGVKDGEVFPKLQELCISDCDRLIIMHFPQNL